MNATEAARLILEPVAAEFDHTRHRWRLYSGRKVARTLRQVIKRLEQEASLL